ncbi:hypothetical protein I350_05568 [Cryptococcus amylolentus CBS 6273]|uniref:Uncharacterized protein n=1 Tax=Cryptococcus amylolentus CBS 6273 TaxID=1296118 RepID=A0A1E3JXN4_9TREE|nr:hypothetical protein I350_05568 [Cryptococcus amylolentus CBS 6273]
MPRTRQPAVAPHADQGLNLATIFPPEICQLILDHLLVLAQSDTFLAFHLMYTCTDMLNSVSPYLYKRVTLHEGNTEKFFYGLADGKMKKGEVKGWQNDGRRLEKKSAVARRLVWLSMVRRVEIMDAEAFVKCITALKALLKRPLGTREEPPHLFFWRPHESNAHEKPVLRLSPRVAPPGTIFTGSSRYKHIRNFKQLARSFTVELDCEDYEDFEDQLAVTARSYDQPYHSASLYRSVFCGAKDMIVTNVTIRNLHHFQLIRCQRRLNRMLVILKSEGDDHRQLVTKLADDIAAETILEEAQVTIQGYRFKPAETAFEIESLMNETFAAGVAEWNSKYSPGREVNFEVL